LRLALHAVALWRCDSEANSPATGPVRKLLHVVTFLH
jgi:hypothetical protein